MASESRDIDMRLPDSISAGSHRRRSDGMCVMETVAYVSGEPHTDRPDCASVVITEFAQRLNDSMPDDATRTRLLGPLVWRIAGTRRDEALEQRLACECADWAVRTVAAEALRACGREADATALASLPRISTPGDAAVARTAAIAAADACAAAAWALAQATFAEAMLADTITASVAAAARAASAAAGYVGISHVAGAAAAAASAGIPWEEQAAFLARLCDIAHDW